MRDQEYLKKIQERQRERDISPEVRRQANRGDAKARITVYRNTQSTEAQATLLEKWGMLASLQFDCMGEPMFA